MLAECYEEGYDEAVVHRPPPYPKGYAEKTYELGKAYFENFKGFGDEWKIVSAEEKFEIDIGGYPFVGISDLVLEHKETGELMVVDHKTKSAASMKKEKDTYVRQLYIYAAHVKKKYGKFPKIMRFNMIKTGEYIDEEFDQKKFDDTMQWVVDTIESILLEREWNINVNSYFCSQICGGRDYCSAKNAVIYGRK